MMDDTQWRYLIAGRIEDPHGRRPAHTSVILGYDRDGIGYGLKVPTAPDGSFVTQALSPGTYMLALIPTTEPPALHPVPLALEIVRLGNADVTGVRLSVRRDVTVRGEVRTADGAAPSGTLAVTSCLDVDGVRHVDCRSASVAADGTFELKNPFGPRVLTAGSGRSIKVLLDGRDVTQTSVDFSAHPKAHLQVVLLP